MMYPPTRSITHELGTDDADQKGNNREYRVCPIRGANLTFHSLLFFLYYYNNTDSSVCQSGHGGRGGRQVSPVDTLEFRREVRGRRASEVGSLAS